MQGDTETSCLHLRNPQTEESEGNDSQLFDSMILLRSDRLRNASASSMPTRRVPRLSTCTLLNGTCWAPPLQLPTYWSPARWNNRTLIEVFCVPASPNDGDCFSLQGYIALHILHALCVLPGCGTFARFIETHPKHPNHRSLRRGAQSNRLHTETQITMQSNVHIQRTTMSDC